MATYDIYTRVSDEDGRSGPSFGSPSEQEAVCRAWIEEQGGAPGEVVYDGNVSGARPADERELGRLIRKVEAGESAGVVVRYIDRFGRSMIENAMSLRRIEQAGGRLVAPGSGFDSQNLNSQSRMVYNILSAVAEAQREQNLESRKQGIRRAVERGVYLASAPPAGYDRREGVLTMQSAAKKLIREAYKRRADRHTYAAVARWLQRAGADVRTVDEWAPSRNRPQGRHKEIQPFAAITENGARQLLSNRAYLGEVTVPSIERGKPETIPGGAWRVITDDAWEAASAAGGKNGKFKNNGKWVNAARLRGLVYCPEGHRMKVGAMRRGDDKGAAYMCTHARCGSRAGILAERLDEFIALLLQQAVVTEEPHVIAVLAGDGRYEDALAAVEQARLELDAFVETVKVTDVGQEGWLRGKDARQAELDAARARLQGTPAPRKSDASPVHSLVGADREVNARFVSRIVVSPVGRGRRVPVWSRVEVWWAGAEAAADLSMAIPSGVDGVPEVPA